MPRQTTMNDLVGRINLYIKRAERDDKVQIFPFEQVNIYQFIGGNTDEYGRRPEVGFYEGRFVDVLARTFLHPDFGGWYCDPKDTGNPNNGYIKLKDEPVITQVEPIENLVEYLQHAQNMENQVL
ncbi:hypothetical protein H6503_04980 [Candidatus Woesearchaeota archaeon]|nr:hypothetical protein [Candidatus Woesearchaeota archaeon]